MAAERGERSTWKDAHCYKNLELITELVLGMNDMMNVGGLLIGSDEYVHFRSAAPVEL